MSALEQNSATNIPEYDAVVIGAGFGGLYAVHKLRNELGLNVKAYDNGGDVGGTWYWNRYPGALSDTESHIYRFSFDKELLQSGSWKNQYLTQPEILGYLGDVADKFDLRRSYDFDTSMESAQFDEATNLWHVTTNKGETVAARNLVTGLGLMSAINKPAFKGVENFQGEVIHTGRWPEGIDLSGKRVAVIGTGSTGQQVIVATAPVVEHLTVFQRSAQYNVPIGNLPQSAEEIDEIKANYDAIWEQVRNSALAFGFEESTVPAMSVSAEERERVFQEAWDIGGGFRFMFGTFSDITTDIDANNAACEFVRKKIRELVKDPVTAENLCPTDLYAKRPLCAHKYFETFNRDNVTLVNVRDNPIEEITAKGLRTADGTEYEFDVLITATGFEVVDGNYTKVHIAGRGDNILREKWKNGPTGYLGMMESGFPNMYMIMGPYGPFTNLPPSIESQVEWIADAIKRNYEDDIVAFDVKPAVQEEWQEMCSEIAYSTLFPKAKSWIFSHNIPGKPNTVMFFFGGLAQYRQALEAAKAANYAAFDTQAGTAGSMGK